MVNYGQQINFVTSLITNIAILLTGSRGETRTRDTHRMKVLHWPLCYSTLISCIFIIRPCTLTNLLGSILLYTAAPAAIFVLLPITNFSL